MVARGTGVDEALALLLCGLVLDDDFPQGRLAGHLERTDGLVEHLAVSRVQPVDDLGNLNLQRVLWVADSVQLVSQALEAALVEVLLVAKDELELLQQQLQDAEEPR